MCASPLIHNKQGVHQHQLYFPLDRFLSKATVRAVLCHLHPLGFYMYTRKHAWGDAVMNMINYKAKMKSE
ncbi:hypothetical protein AAZX31_10G144200 [Glycine max]